MDTPGVFCIHLNLCIILMSSKASKRALHKNERVRSSDLVTSCTITWQRWCREMIPSSRTVNFVMQIYLDPIFALSKHQVATFNTLAKNPAELQLGQNWFCWRWNLPGVSRSPRFHSGSERTLPAWENGLWWKKVWKIHTVRSVVILSP